MLRQIRLDKFPKKSTTFRPQILGSLLLHDRRPYDPSVAKLTATDTTYNELYQLYLARKLNNQVKQNMEFIEGSPNLLLLQAEPYSIIIEEQCGQSLKEYLSIRQNETGLPYLNQMEAKNLVWDVIRSMESYEKNSIDYISLVDQNIVKASNGQWQLSLAAAITNAYAFDKSCYDSSRKGKQAVFYGLGSLVFKLLFGFVPFQQNSKKPQEFRFSAYIDQLEHQPIKKMLKIYYFAERIQMLSEKCKMFVEQCLSGKVTSFEQLRNHTYLTTYDDKPIRSEDYFLDNREIKMLNYFDKKYHSLIMASIDKRKKSPYQKLHIREQSDVAGFLQLRQTCSRQPVLKFLKFSEIGTQNQIKKQLQQKSSDNFKIDCRYFGREFQFEEKERPTLQLIKFIDKDKSTNYQLYQKQDRQSKIKLYAFPYAMAFQLANVYNQQPQQIKKKILQLVPYLLELSSLSQPVQNLERLHETKTNYKKFEDFKVKYRELINFIYKHFLNEAMKRYNAKKQNLTVTEKIRLKEEGLDYYRLCLKLMEVSLIMRKGGKQLDLQRIQTSQRKQIQQDLEIILKTYFPNRVEIK